MHILFSISAETFENTFFDTDVDLRLESFHEFLKHPQYKSVPQTEPISPLYSKSVHLLIHPTTAYAEWKWPGLASVNRGTLSENAIDLT